MLTGMMWLVTRRRPLIFFGLPGAFLLSAGLAVGLWVVYTYTRVHSVVMGYALVSMSLGIGGALILCTGAILYSVQELVTTLAQTNSKVAQKSQASGGIRQWIKRYWSLLFFALPGVFLLLGGMAVGVWRARIYFQTHALPLAYALLIMLLFTTGSLWFIGGIVLYSIRTLVRDVIQSRS